MFVQPPESAFEGMLQLLGRALNCLLHSFRLMADHYWLKAHKTGIQQTAYVVIAGFFIAVLVGKEYIHPCDSLIEVVDSPPNDGFDMLGQHIDAFDVAIGVDLNVHVSMLLSFCLSNGG
jgi:hypothetical protein